MNMDHAFLLLFDTMGTPIYIALGAILGVITSQLIGRFLLRSGRNTFID